jgi:dTDP-4-amino-4,6-dideoxygalactose transaminase
LGAIGHLGCYSFHETKNYICGEGGALCINDPRLIERAEIIRDKGTNRQRYFRGEVDKYTWVDVGSSYVPSEICSAFLYGQLELLDAIAQRRREIYENYARLLAPLAQQGLLQLPCLPEVCQSNYHLFYVLLPTRELRDLLMDRLRSRGITAVFHYVPLHTSPMGHRLGTDQRSLPHTEELSGRVLRLPFFYGIEQDELEYIAHVITDTLYTEHISATLKRVHQAAPAEATSPS